MIFGFVNLFNPFINGFIFLLGGIQILSAKKYELRERAKRHVKKTMCLIKTFFSLKRRLGRHAKKTKEHYQRILQDVFQEEAAKK